MSDVGLISTQTLRLPWLGLEITYNPETLVFTWAIIFLILILAIFLRRTIRKPASRAFAGLETLYNSFSHMAEEAMGLPAYSASPFILVAFLISQAFFGLFVGTVQALVFALLALTYIAILREA